MTNQRIEHYVHCLLGLLLAVFPLSAAQASGTAIELTPRNPPADAGLLAPELPQAIDPATEISAAAEDAGASVAALSIAEALERAVSSHPGLASLEKEYWALDSLAWQEGRRPNPELELEFEEFGGTREAQGFRALATSLTYTQPIERGGKRSKREIAASLEREVVLWDIAELEHEIQAQVRTAFAAAQVAQYEVAQLQDYRGLVQRIYDTVAASVEAGRSARLELERFDIELARLDLEIAVAERNQAQALLELAGTCGASAADFPAVAPADTQLAVVPSLADLQALLEGHPALARYDAEYEALCALLELEHANGVPDMALFGGVTRLNEIEETVFKVGVAWDLPLNDKNEGNISAAGYYLEQVEDNRAAARLKLKGELAVSHHLALNALANYQAYGDSLMPAAEQALALTEEGYRYGKFELLDVLDAQRTVLELESEQAAALMEFNLRSAEIEALLNASLVDWDGHQPLAPSSPAIDAMEAEPLASEEHDHE